MALTRPARRRLGERQRPDVGDRRHDVQQLLILGRHRLAAELVVQLHPVVVRRVVRGRHVHAADHAGRSQPGDHERQLGRRQRGAVAVRVVQVGGDAVAGVDLAGQPGQPARRQAHQGVLGSQEAVAARHVAEHPHVVGHHHRQVRPPGEALPEEVAVALDGHRHGGRVQPVGAVADLAPAPAGAERQHLPEGIEQQGQPVGLQVSGDHLRMGERDGARQPARKLSGGPLPERPVLVGEQVLDVGRTGRMVGHRRIVAAGWGLAGGVEKVGSPRHGAKRARAACGSIGF